MTTIPPRALHATLLIALSAGCSAVRIEGPELVALAAQVGDGSAALMTRAPDTSANVISEDLEAVGTSLVAFVLAHDDWAGAAARTAPEVEAARVEVPAIAWDGETLDAGLAFGDGGALVATLRLFRSGSQQVDGVPGGRCIHPEPTGSAGEVWCPPFIDRTVSVQHVVTLDDAQAVVTLNAVYGLALDGDGHPVGGQVDVHYVVEPGEEAPRGGVVSATFHGRDRVQVFADK